MVDVLICSRPLNTLRNSGRVGAVVLSNTFHYFDSLLGESGVLLDRKGAVAAWGEGSKQAFSDLQEISKRVIGLGDIPRPISDIPDCLSINPGASHRCAIDLSTHGYRDRDLISASKSSAPRGVSFIDPTSLVCPTDPCPVIDADGLIKYRDDNHLTKSFSAALGQGLGRLIQSSLDKP